MVKETSVMKEKSVMKDSQWATFHGHRLDSDSRRATE